MKVRIEMDENLQEEEVVIRCKGLDEKVHKLYELIQGSVKEPDTLLLLKANKEYYFPLSKILFFETSENCVHAHTGDDVYQTNYRLYELEELLPGYFMRVSKSTILNLNQIHSISKNLAASSSVEFAESHKQVYVSKYYYKPLKCRLNEKRTSL